MFPGRLSAGRNLRILAYLLEMSAHRAAGHLRIAPLHGLKNSFVMELPALRSTFDVKDFYPLFAQQSNNGIDQRKNQRIGSRLGQREVEVEVSFDEGPGISLSPIHHGNRLPHGHKFRFLNACRCQRGNPRFQD